MDLYLLPGLGADHRLFQRLDTGPHPRHHLDHADLPMGSSLADFAQALAPRVDASRPHALIGVSMGGMVAQELAAITHPQRVVIISSWKGPQEMPPAIRLLRGRHPERLLTEAFLKHVLPMVRWQMGVEDAASHALFNELLQVHNIAQLKTQIAACVKWEGPAQAVPGLVHLHGDSDRLMPIGLIHQPVVIPDGGHFMVFDRAAEVSQAVGSALIAGPAGG